MLFRSGAGLYDLGGTDVLTQPPDGLMPTESGSDMVLSEASSMHTIPTGASGQSGSFDAQDWEARYCLDESPR